MYVKYMVRLAYISICVDWLKCYDNNAWQQASRAAPPPLRRQASRAAPPLPRRQARWAAPSPLGCLLLSILTLAPSPLQQPATLLSRRRGEEKPAQRRHFPHGLGTVSSPPSSIESKLLLRWAFASEFSSSPPLGTYVLILHLNLFGSIAPLRYKLWNWCNLFGGLSWKCASTFLKVKLVLTLD